MSLLFSVHNCGHPHDAFRCVFLHKICLLPNEVQQFSSSFVGTYKIHTKTKQSSRYCIPFVIVPEQLMYSDVCAGLFGL